jgi:transcriptional regulator with XRE-family HTH domain
VNVRLLGTMIRRHREHRNESQEVVASRSGKLISRGDIANLEQGIRLPKPDVLAAICAHLEVPIEYWQPFTREEARLRFEFEELLSEITGEAVSVEAQDAAARTVVERRINRLLTETSSPSQTFDLLNSICVFYGIRPFSIAFFSRYLGTQAFANIEALRQSVELYQKDAIRLFVSFREAFRVLNSDGRIQDLLAPLEPRDMRYYHERADWSLPNEVEEYRLPDLGYISARRVRQEQNERQFLARGLTELAQKIEERGGLAISEMTERVRRRYDSLLRKFNSQLPHGVSSPLFTPEPDELLREAERLGPKSESELERMEETQRRALENLAQYLSSDFLDVYVATSMRTDADFVSVNRFVTQLFSNAAVRPLKLRYFNPTQSWIEDRIAKGLVEALMLKRSSLTVYMAQKSDTFGKDSEASVALGQGKPVIVYVPKLHLAGVFDLEQLYYTPRNNLLAAIKTELPRDAEEIDETVDDEAIVGRIAQQRLEMLTDDQLLSLVSASWADFDLHGEASRFRGHEQTYRSWIEKVAKGERPALPLELRTPLVRTLVAVGLRMESRAKIFKEVHPLALQVILSSGVLNGILVARTAEQCARVMAALLSNRLTTRLEKDEQNYRVIETDTGSTIRVISRHELLRNAFDIFYSEMPHFREM